MSGGQLVVLDRLGRPGRQFPLTSGVATLGRDLACDIRVLLPAVRAHHASVAVHATQTVVRNESDGETLVNGQPVSVAALRHNDVITVAGRSLRWEYDDPGVSRPLAAEPALHVRKRAARTPRRASSALPAPRPFPAPHRASMPAGVSVGGASCGHAVTGSRQVAIVQPQRRDTGEQQPTSSRAVNSPRQAQKRPRSSDNDLTITTPSDSDSDRPARKSTPRLSPKSLAMQATTKATLWIESRKTSPRKSLTAKVQTPPPVAPRKAVASAKKTTPLRMTVLRKVQSAHKMRVTKIEAPLTIDHTKQAAIMLMTGHTPKPKPPGSQGSARRTPRAPSFVVKRPSPVRKTPARRSGRGTTCAQVAVDSDSSRRSSGRRSGGISVSVLEITDSDTPSSTTRRSAAPAHHTSGLRSPLLPSPKKSALKGAKSMRKTESIKFDLSNLENQGDDVLTITDTTQDGSFGDSVMEDDVSLRYSDTSSPSPRKSIHSRGSRMLESLGTPLFESRVSERSTLTPESPRARKSLRGSIILQKALDSSENGNDTTAYSRRTTKTLSDHSLDATVSSAAHTRTASPRKSKQKLESYSIVDLVSLDSNETGDSASVYDSVGSTRTSSIVFGTPQTSAGRKTRSTIDSNFLGSSTPYVRKTRASARSNSSPNISTRKTSPNKSTRSSGVSRRSKSLTTPENTQKHISVNSTRVSRASRSRSRISESDLQYISYEEAEDSPKSSRRVSRASNVQSANSSPQNKSSPRSSLKKRNSSRQNLTINITAANTPQNEGALTPENVNSPEEVGTPVLSIQSLLDSSQSSLAPHRSRPKRVSVNVKRKTTGTVGSGRKRRSGGKSKSLNVIVRKSLRSRKLSNESSLDSNGTDENALQPDNEDTVTPKSAVKLVPEAVKNKHSTAKKPQSKRSLIDNLHESDIVKQLFNSPVKRKLSRSMTEFSRKLFDDEEVAPRRPTRNTVALTGRTPDNSLLDSDRTECITPDNFVSPLSTPSVSPNLTGIKRLFGQATPESDSRDMKGVKNLLRSRRSIKNDVTDVSGVKHVFAKSPKNRPSDVRVKEVFAEGPGNDLRRVSGVKSLFQSQNVAKNDLSDVRGVRNLFKRKSAANDLRNVSGVKKTLQARSPKNDLTDVRGVRRLFREQKRQASYDISGVEELFNESSHVEKKDPERLFDELVGKPPIKAVYSKSVIMNRSKNRSASRKNKSLHVPVDVVTNNVEEWLQRELQKRLHKDTAREASTSKGRQSARKPVALNANVSRQLQRLATDTVEGAAPILSSRVRNSTITKSPLEATGSKKSASALYDAHTLPIKKRSLVADKSRQDVASNRLPIKKRAVLHSTPVKGGYLTMNASELGRVSPIAVVDKTALDNDTAVTRSQQPKSSPRPKGRVTKARVVHEDVEVDTRAEPQKSPRRRRAATARAIEEIKNKTQQGRRIRTNTKLPPAEVEPKKSPIPKRKPTKTKEVIKDAVQIAPRESRNKTESSNTEKEVSVAAPGMRRTRNNTQKQETQVKKAPKQTMTKAKAKSIVETDKTVESQKPSPKRTRAKAKAEAPVQAKSTRNRKSIQATNATKRKVSLVISKKPPVMSPKPEARTTRRTQKVSAVAESPKTISTRRQKAKMSTENIKSPKTTRAKVTKTSVVVGKPSPKLNPRMAKTETVPKPTRATRAKASLAKTRIESPKKSQTPNKRGRKTVDKTVEPEPQTKRARGTRITNEIRPNKTTTKREKTQSEQSEPRKNLRGKAESTTPAPKTRKRKLDESVVLTKATQSEAKPRGRTVTEVVKGKGKTSAVKDEGVEVTRGRRRGRAGVETSTRTVPSPKAGRPARGRKPASLPDPAPQAAGRKRKTDAPPSPAKEPAKKSRAASAAPAAANVRRATRARPEPVVVEGARGRSRRR